jgi:diaminopimelate epimerase
VVEVRIEDAHASLRGPSVLVATGTVSDAWWTALA